MSFFSTNCLANRLPFSAAAATPPSPSLAIHSAARVLRHWCITLNDYVHLRGKQFLTEGLKPTTSSDKIAQFTVWEFRQRMEVGTFYFSGR